MSFPTISLLALALMFQATDSTLPPTGATPLYTVDGRGVQIYHCAAQAGGFQWVFDSPEAVLVDMATHAQVGTHGAGPTWTWSDGSSITGKVLQKQASPDAAAIPWLLLEAHAAGNTTGALTGVTFVRRSSTQAGAAPAGGCDAQHEANVIRVPYEATYTFYSSK